VWNKRREIYMSCRGVTWTKARSCREREAACSFEENVNEKVVIQDIDEKKVRFK
jgi:hypothetical protein